MALIPFPAAAPLPSELVPTPWRPGEATQENLVGQYRRVLRGRERWQGTVRWPITSRRAEAMALRAFLAAMDDPTNTARLPLDPTHFPTFAFVGGTTASTVRSAIGNGAVLDRWQDGFAVGCAVYLARLRQVLVMHSYSFQGDFADRLTLRDNISAIFTPNVPLVAGDTLLPATIMHIRKAAGKRVDLPHLAGPEWGPFALEFVEDVTPEG